MFLYILSMMEMRTANTKKSYPALYFMGVRETVLLLNEGVDRPPAKNKFKPVNFHPIVENLEMSKPVIFEI